MSDKSFGFRKEGNLVRVVDAADVEVISADLPPSDAESLTRAVQLDSASEFVGHLRFGGGPFSPGTCPGGSALVDECPDDFVREDAGDVGDTSDVGDDIVTGCDGGRPVLAGDLVGNEVLVNVPSGEEGDANMDGVRDATDDEFVEIHNLSGERLDLAAVSIRVNDAERHSFTGCLEAGESIVVFAGTQGGLPSLPGVQFLVSDRTFRLSNGGGTLSLFAGEAVVDTITWASSPAASLLRRPELSLNGDFAPHNDGRSALFSPGTCADGAPLSTGCAD